MSKERRVHPRSDIEMAASYGIPEDMPETREATIVNASSGGFCFYSAKTLPLEKDLLLAIELGQGEEVTIKVRAVWCKSVEDSDQYMVGVRIIEEEGPDLEAFLEFYQTIESNNPSA